MNCFVSRRNNYDNVGAKTGKKGRSTVFISNTIEQRSEKLFKGRGEDVTLPLDKKALCLINITFVMISGGNES